MTVLRNHTKVFYDYYIGVTTVSQKYRLTILLSGYPLDLWYLNFFLNKTHLILTYPYVLGKTTLAHMVARHAGYNVVEINASDDRSIDAFKTALENATQMRSVVDREGRPNCLVFDEIDGAPQASVDFLIKFVNGTVTKKPKKGQAQKQTLLKRPIICICNDVFVPSLRALRQIAFVVKFPPTSSARLAERLMEIARRQQIKTDLGAMMALAEKSNKDIRSCLSVLHFFKAQRKPVTLSEIYKTSVGQKDMQKGNDNLMTYYLYKILLNFLNNLSVVVSYSNCLKNLFE